MKRALRVLLATVSLTVSLSAVARAQMKGADIDLQAFRPAMDSRGIVTVNASQVIGDREVSFGLVTTWGFRVLELRDGETTYDIENIITPTLQAAFGLGRRLEVGATVPFHVISGDAFDAQGVGDVGLHAKVRLLDTSRHAVGLAVLGSVTFSPGYGGERWLGGNQIEAQPTLIVDKEWRGGTVRLAANVGFRRRQPRSFMMGADETVRVESEVPFGVGGSYAVVPQRFDLMAEVFGGVPVGGKNYFPLEGVTGIKLYMARNSFFMVGGGAGLAAGATSPDARAFIGIVFEPNVGDRDRDGLKDDVDRCPADPEDFDEFRDSDGCPEPDNDSDQLPDAIDRCPNEPEDRDGIADADGCPDLEDLDRDGDHLRDDRDACPDDPEDVDRWKDGDGCPDPDNDTDGILDLDDLCPDEPEDVDAFEDKEGCPDPDNDKDRIADKADKCPDEPENYNGHRDDDGCIDPDVRLGANGTIELFRPIYFETDKAIIKSVSYPTLNAVAQVMDDNPDILLLEVQGHADERGPDDHNDKLTQARADAVRAYLIGRKVAAARLSARGYGETLPVDEHHDARAWSKNRRVELVIKKRAGE